MNIGHKHINNSEHRALIRENLNQSEQFMKDENKTGRIVLVKARFQKTIVGYWINAPADGWSVLHCFNWFKNILPSQTLSLVFLKTGQ